MKYIPLLSLALIAFKLPDIIRAAKEPRPVRMISRSTQADGFQVVTTTEYQEAHRLSPERVEGLLMEGTKLAFAPEQRSAGDALAARQAQIGAALREITAKPTSQDHPIKKYADLLEVPLNQQGSLHSKEIDQ